MRIFDGGERLPLWSGAVPVSCSCSRLSSGLRGPGHLQMPQASEARRKVEFALHGRKGDAHDQDVEHHHALSHARHREGQPLTWSCPQGHNHSLPDLARPAASDSPLLRQARSPIVRPNRVRVVVACAQGDPQLRRLRTCEVKPSPGSQAVDQADWHCPVPAGPVSPALSLDFLLR